MNTGSIPASVPVNQARAARGEDASHGARKGDGGADFAELAGVPAKEHKVGGQGKPAADKPEGDAVIVQSEQGELPAEMQGEPQMAEPAAYGGQSNAGLIALINQAAHSAVQQASRPTARTVPGEAVRAVANQAEPGEPGRPVSTGADGSLVAETAKTVGKPVAMPDDGQPSQAGVVVRDQHDVKGLPRAGQQPGDDGAPALTRNGGIDEVSQPAADRRAAPVSAQAAPASANQAGIQAPAQGSAANPAQNAVQALVSNGARLTNANAERAISLAAARLSEVGGDRNAMAMTVTSTGTETVARTTPASVTVANFWQYVAGNSGPAIVNTLTPGEPAQQPMQATQNTTSLQVQLHPKTLGTVNVAISRTGNVVTVEIIAQTQQAEQLLKSDASNLIEAFRSADGKIEEVQVRIAAAGETNASGLRGAREGERDAFGQAFGDSAGQAEGDADTGHDQGDDLRDPATGQHEFTDQPGDDREAANHRTGLYL